MIRFKKSSIEVYLIVGICLGFGPPVCVADWNLGFAGALIFQSGDTLKFSQDDSLVYEWILNNNEKLETGGYHIEKAKVSQDNRRFFIYEEEYFPNQDSTFTQLTLYDARRNKIWSRTQGGARKFSFELSRIYGDRIILFVNSRSNVNPEMIILKDGTRSTVDLTQWTSIVNYEISPDGRYILFHAKKPYNYKLWDYLYFIDLKTSKNWEYLFPICFSCKRGKIDLKVYDDGKSEAIYKNEHRIFDREGNLIDIFVKLD
ncbi:MAG: hypothetical protein ACPL28_02110 [bacterium]